MLSNNHTYFSFFEFIFDEHLFLSLVITGFFFFVFFFLHSFFSNMLADSIFSYNLMFKKVSDFTKFFLSHFLILSIFNIQFHIILVEIFDKILSSFFDFFNIQLFISGEADNNFIELN